MNKKRTIVAALVIALILLVGGIMAYFTDTDEKTNVFTIGSNVDITLVEDTSWTKQTEGNFVNKYMSNNATGTYPGASIAKSPYVTSAEGTDNTYVFIKVTSPVVDGEEVLEYTPNSDEWIQVGSDSTATGTVTRVFAYAKNVEGTPTLTALVAEGQTPAVFGNVTINDYFGSDPAKSSMIAGKSYDLDVKAYGIQATGLNATAIQDVWGNFNS